MYSLESMYSRVLSIVPPGVRQNILHNCRPSTNGISGLSTHVHQTIFIAHYSTSVMRSCLSGTLSLHLNTKNALRAL